MKPSQPANEKWEPTAKRSQKHHFCQQITKKERNCAKSFVHL